MPQIKCEGWVPPNKAQESVDMLREIFNNRVSLDITFDTEERFSYHIDDIKTNTFYHKSIIEKLNSPKTVQDFCKANRCWAAMDVGGAWYQYDKNNKPYLTVGQWYSTFNIQIHKIENVIFPKVLWDKSLVAPDGRLILIEGKKEKKKKVCKFKAGKWYKHKKYGVIIKCTRSIAGNLVFESEGCVLGMLGVEASCDWYEMKHYNPDKKKPRVGNSLKRGEPIFVWSSEADENIPAVVKYFHSFYKYGIFTFSPDHFGKKWEPYPYYRKFDPKLVGVPRKDWRD